MNDSTRSVSGDLKAFNIFDVTQSLMSGRKTALVTVQSGTRKGYVYFREGQIVNALDDGLTKGEQAVMDIFSWTEGSFTIDFEVLPEDINIQVPTDHLLLEVARNLDEVRRDRGLDPEVEAEPEAEVGGDMKERVGAKLRSRLNTVFKKVAVDAEPGRARYTANAFDSLLQALLELSGTVLFLRAGHRPRIKTSTGFNTLKDEIIGEDEIKGFLDGLLSDAEQTELRETKEVATFFHSPALGAFKVTVVNEHGSKLVTFSPAGRAVPRLDDVISEPAALQQLRETETGLVVIAGPLGAGKGLLVSSIIADHMVRRDAFAFQLSDRNRHAFTLDSGFCVHRALPAPNALPTAVRGALEQEPDVLALVGAADPDALGLALSAAAGQRLVLFGLESHTPSDTIVRLLRLSRTIDGDSLAPLLADRLRLVVDCRAGEAGLDVLPVDGSVAEMLRTEDVAALRRMRVATPAPR